MANLSVALLSRYSKFQSRYPQTALNAEYRAHPDYQSIDTGFKMTANNPRADSGVDAYHLWATPDALYQARLCWTGGKAPFKITLVHSPVNAYIGSSGKVSQFTESEDAVVPGLFTQTRESNINTITWQPTVDQIGQSFKFTAAVEDVTGDTLVFSWYAMVDPTRFVIVDSVNGSDANPGTFASPLQSFEVAHGHSNKIVLLKDGVYVVTGIASALDDINNTARSFIGLGTNVVLNMNQAQFGVSSLSNDITFINVEFSGNINGSNNRIFNIGGIVRRPLWWRCRWSNVTVGSSGIDNPSCIFFANLGGSAAGVQLPLASSHSNITIAECSVDSSVRCQMVVTFASSGVLVEDCHAMYGVNVYSNGSHFIHIKDQSCDVTIRFNSCEGITGDSAIQIGNQSAWHCHRTEVCYNLIKNTGEAAIRWNVQNTVAGDPNVGQSIGATRQYCYRNTLIGTTDLFQIPHWLGTSEPVNVSDNLCITPAVSIVTASGYVLLGDNTSKAATVVKVNGKVDDAYRSALVGRVGAEIASI